MMNPTANHSAQLFDTTDPRIRLRTIGVRKLRLDCQSSRGLNQGVVAQFVTRFNEGMTVEPVRAYFDGESYYLAEGFHRVAAAKMAGRRMILADVRWGTREDAEIETGRGESRCHPEPSPNGQPIF